MKFKKILKLPIYKNNLLWNYCASSLNSKVYLSKDKDYHGLEKLEIDWKISNNDKKSLIFTHKYLSSLLASRKLGKLESKIKNYNWDLWNGSSHFMSTTVMSKSKDGVVDTNCRSWYR